MDIVLTDRNRYGEEVVLKHLDGNKYLLESKFSYRIIFEPDGTVVAIDPSGGPFLELGSVVQNKKIKSISKTGMLELENL